MSIRARVFWNYFVHYFIFFRIPSRRHVVAQDRIFLLQLSARLSNFGQQTSGFSADQKDGGTIYESKIDDVFGSASAV